MIRFSQFPPVKLAIAYGSVFLPHAKRIGLPDFILVVDGKVQKWHEQNLMKNPTHYGSLAQLAIRHGHATRLHGASPAIFSAPMATVDFETGAFGSVERPSKYLVVTEKEFKEDVANWSSFFVAARLQKPTLFIKPNGKESETVLSSNVTPPYNDLIQKNCLNAMRLSLLLSGSQLTLRDLLRTTAALSYTGDIRNSLLDDSVRTRSTVSTGLLLWSHLYAPLIPKLHDEWILRLEDGDNEILSGRYTPQQYDEAAVKGRPRFDFCFKSAEDEKLLKDVLDKTRHLMEDYAKAQYVARLAGLSATQKVPAELVEAQTLLNSRVLFLEQSFSSEAHCSLFHSLPNSIQALATAASARERLRRIFSPFSLLQSEHDRDVLGGPLPWERKCVEAALKNLVAKSSRRAAIRGITFAGVGKSTAYGLQKCLRV